MVINESKGRVNPRTHHPIGSFTKLPFFPCCLVVYLPPLWKMMDFVSWDDDMTPIFLESHNPAMFQTSNQPKNPWIKGRVNPWTNHPIGCLKLPAEQGRPCNGGHGKSIPCHCRLISSCAHRCLEHSSRILKGSSAPFNLSEFSIVLGWLVSEQIHLRLWHCHAGYII